MINSSNFITYRSRLEGAMRTLNLSDLEVFRQKLNETSNSKIFIAGNGGSAALASHFCTDLVKSFELSCNPRIVMSLVDNSSFLTATANDENFERIFARQIGQFATRNDIFICISSSGNSKNLVHAINCARKMDLFTIALTGFDGGEVSKIVDLNIHVKTQIGDYGVTEDAHSVICHYIAFSMR